MLFNCYECAFIHFSSAWMAFGGIDEIQKEEKKNNDDDNIAVLPIPTLMMFSGYTTPYVYRIQLSIFVRQKRSRECASLNHMFHNNSRNVYIIFWYVMLRLYRHCTVIPGDTIIVYVQCVHGRLCSLLFRFSSYSSHHHHSIWQLNFCPFSYLSKHDVRCSSTQTRKHTYTLTMRDSKMNKLNENSKNTQPR